MFNVNTILYSEAITGELWMLFTRGIWSERRGFIKIEIGEMSMIYQRNSGYAVFVCKWTGWELSVSFPIYWINLWVRQSPQNPNGCWPVKMEFWLLASENKQTDLSV